MTDPGRVTGLWLAEASGDRPRAVETVAAVADRGLRGDRYFRGTGYYSGFDGCQVTFVDRDVLADARDRFDVDLTDGRHRRNVVVADCDLPSLEGQRFRVGDAVFAGTRPRPPCAHLEAIADAPGAMDALREERGGLCADVVESGPVAVDDDVVVLGPVGVDSDSLAAAIRERHEE